MKVVLLSDIKGLGERGDVCEVGGGYAMNFLIPRGLASNVADAAAKDAVQMKISRQRRADESASSLSAVFEKLPDSVVVRANANDRGTLFSAVTADAVAKQISEECGIAVRTDWFSFDPVKEVGTHTVQAVYGDAVKRVTVTVERSV